MSTEEKQRVLEELQVTQEDRDKIAQETVGQFDNELYKKARADRLTASKFGEVVKRRPTTSPEALVKRILSQDHINVPSINYGKENESVAIRLFEAGMNIPVQRTGLHIDVVNPYLAASPDGLIGDDSVIEVTCCKKANDNGWNLLDITKDKALCLELTKENEIKLKKNHNIYYQIQGQLNITNRKMCYFVVFINESTELHIERIERDSDLWTNEMLPKLKDFYMSNVLPEILISSIPVWYPVCSYGISHIVPFVLSWTGVERYHTLNSSRFEDIGIKLDSAVLLHGIIENHGNLSHCAQTFIEQGKVEFEARYYWKKASIVEVGTVSNDGLITHLIPCIEWQRLEEIIAWHARVAHIAQCHCWPRTVK
ncbi:hypothetical protein CBL_12319 [Carabus blaptoides fortunei]